MKHIMFDFKDLLGINKVILYVYINYQMLYSLNLFIMLLI